MRNLRNLRTLLAILAVPILAFAIVGGLDLLSDATASGKSDYPAPSKVEVLEGTSLSQVTLTAQAATRLDVRTARVRESVIARNRQRGAGGGAKRKVIPYAAVLYDATGMTYAYVNPRPLVYIRKQVVVDYIDGPLAILSEGPPVGAAVVTVGATELFGTELGIDN